MQTFLPFRDFAKSAESLDWRRLGKQRLETKQILKTLLALNDSPEQPPAKVGWRNHPAVRMWRGYDVALAEYGCAVCIEWMRRGYTDNLFELFVVHIERQQVVYPLWLGDEAFHRSHRANLVHKLPEHYVPLFGQLPFEPYVWPVERPQE